jgi:hypothetical protein
MAALRLGLAEGNNPHRDLHCNGGDQGWLGKGLQRVTVADLENIPGEAGLKLPLGFSNGRRPIHVSDKFLGSSAGHGQAWLVVLDEHFQTNISHLQWT